MTSVIGASAIRSSLSVTLTSRFGFVWRWALVAGQAPGVKRLAEAGPARA
jgi:hypothetical protein